MLSLRQSLGGAGLTTPFSIRKDLETYPRSLREIIRVLQLPELHLSWDKHQQLWEESYDEAQGIACVDGQTCIITTHDRIFLRTSSAGSWYNKVVAEKHVSHFPLQTDLAPFCLFYYHFSDPDTRDGLVFFLLKNALGGDAPIVLFACDLQFRVVGYTKMGPEVSDSCCGFHPWNKLLYFREGGLWARSLLAWDVGEYFVRHQSKDLTQWGKHIEISRKADEDITLRDSTGQQIQIEDIQGITFSPNGRLYLTHYHDYSIPAWAGPWANYLSVYNALTGRQMWFSGDIDYEGDYDEIEGISLFPAGGEVFFIHVDNDCATDEYYLHRFTMLESLVAAVGGDVSKVI